MKRLGKRRAGDQGRTSVRLIGNFATTEKGEGVSSRCRPIHSFPSGENLFFLKSIFVNIWIWIFGRLVVSQRSVLDIGGFEIQIQIQRFEWV